MGWLSGWTYRKSITLARASGAVTDLQMALNVGESSGSASASVHCEGHCQADFDDIRFTAADGTTLLPYWIYNTYYTTPNRTATIWVKFDSIGTSNTTFYLYYGKADATAGTNGDDTFIKFDDFQSYADGAACTRWSSTYTSFVANNDYAYTNSQSGLVTCNTASKGASIAIGSNLTADFSIKVALLPTVNNKDIRWIVQGDANGPHGYFESDGNVYAYYSGGGHNLQAYSGWSWYMVEWNNFNLSADTCDIWINGTKKATGAGFWYAPSYVNGLYLYSEQSSFTYYIDMFIVSKWYATNPAWGSWGSEETESVTIPIFQFYYNCMRA